MHPSEVLTGLTKKQQNKQQRQLMNMVLKTIQLHGTGSEWNYRF